MIIIHTMKTLPRLVEAALAERLRVMPAVVVTGARQTGKSTLAAERVPGARRYATLDELDVLDAARRDAEALVGGPGAGKKARGGLLLHTGSALEWLAPDVLAVPWWRVL
jgi:hypothetical protein